MSNLQKIKKEFDKLKETLILKQGQFDEICNQIREEFGIEPTTENIEILSKQLESQIKELDEKTKKLIKKIEEKLDGFNT